MVQVVAFCLGLTVVVLADSGDSNNTQSRINSGIPTVSLTKQAAPNNANSSAVVNYETVTFTSPESVLLMTNQSTSTEKQIAPPPIPDPLKKEHSLQQNYKQFDSIAQKLQLVKSGTKITTEKCIPSHVTHVRAKKEPMLTERTATATRGGQIDKLGNTLTTPLELPPKQFVEYVTNKDVAVEDSNYYLFSTTLRVKAESIKVNPEIPQVMKMKMGPTGKAHHIIKHHDDTTSSMFKTGSIQKLTSMHKTARPTILKITPALFSKLQEHERKNITQLSHYIINHNHSQLLGASEHITIRSKHFQEQERSKTTDNFILHTWPTVTPLTKINVNIDKGHIKTTTTKTQSSLSYEQTPLTEEALHPNRVEADLNQNTRYTTRTDDHSESYTEQILTYDSSQNSNVLKDNDQLQYTTINTETLMKSQSTVIRVDEFSTPSPIDSRGSVASQSTVVRVDEFSTPSPIDSRGSVASQSTVVRVDEFSTRSPIESRGSVASQSTVVRVDEFSTPSPIESRGSFASQPTVVRVDEFSTPSPIESRGSVASQPTVVRVDAFSTPSSIESKHDGSVEPPTSRIITENPTIQTQVHRLSHDATLPATHTNIKRKSLHHSSSYYLPTTQSTKYFSTEHSIFSRKPVSFHPTKKTTRRAFDQIFNKAGDLLRPKTTHTPTTMTTARGSSVSSKAPASNGPYPSRAPEPAAERRWTTEADAPDMAPSVYRMKMETFLRNQRKPREEIQEIEAATRPQRGSELWMSVRRHLLTASNFGTVCKRQAHTRCDSLVGRLLYGEELALSSMQYGRDHERVAVERVAAMGIRVEPCGLFIDEHAPFLAATPDGLIGEHGLLEVKCPYSAEHLTPDEAIVRRKGMMSTFWRVEEGRIMDINKNHSYYYQIQGQLHITNRKYGMFVIWTPKGIKMERVDRDDEFWANQMVNKLTAFYMDCLLPEIVDPRRKRNLPIRNPQYILDAINMRMVHTKLSRVL